MTFLTSNAAARQRFYQFATSQNLMVNKVGTSSLVAGNYGLLITESGPRLFYGDNEVDMAILGEDHELETLVKETA